MARLFVCGLSAAVLITGDLHAAQAKPACAATGEVAVVPRSHQHDITSHINGKVYRVSVALPPDSKPGVAYPALYVLDANVAFLTAVDAVALQTFGNSIVPVIVVGIGYPSEDLSEWRRRRDSDLTLTPEVNPQAANAAKRDIGGVTFLRVIEEELRPFVERQYRIDRSNQALFGMSGGGRLAAYTLFDKPTAFNTYIIASPAISGSRTEALRDEAAFAARARAGEIRVKVLVTSAADESPEMISAAKGLAERLTSVNPQTITAAYTSFAGEIHNTVLSAALNRGLRFAFAKPATKK
jgi:predicted alpha/beta superfamily hydrolase